jgi:hypothetical protein
MYNQSNCNNMPKMWGGAYNFFNEIVLICLEILNLFKMGVAPLVQVLFRFCKKKKSMFKFQWKFQDNSKPLV